ncbi:MAG: helix-turn-helix transcriptional regulator [Myxococcota bacterium]
MRGDQLARQWQLIQLLARSRGGMGLDQLAQELECVRRTVYRDLDALMYAGFPVTSEKRDGRVFYKLLDSFALGDVPFTTDELLALAFGEDLLRTLEGTVFHDSVRSALAKIRSGLGPELSSFLEQFSDAFRVLPGPHKRYGDSREVIRALNEAVLSRRSVRIVYRTGRTGEEGERSFDPYRVWYRDGALYALGHDHRSGELRTFAVDRIRGIESTGEPFDVPEDFDFDAYVAQAFGVVSEPAVVVRIRFAADRATQIRERTWHPSQTLAEEPGGDVVLAMQVGASSELRDWILSFGASAEVLEPESLRGSVREAIREAARVYADSPE